MPDNTSGSSTVEPEQSVNAATVAPRDYLDSSGSSAVVAATEPTGLASVPEATSQPHKPAKLVNDEAVATQSPVKLAKISKAGDFTFQGLAVAAGILICLTVLFIGVFLTGMSFNSLAQNKANFFLSTEWQVQANPLRFGILSLLWTTVYTSVIALIIAVPVAVGIALLITHYIPGRLGRTIGFLIDLLAAVPSIIYGLWGAKVFGPFLAPLYDAISMKPSEDRPFLGTVIRLNPLGREISSYGNILTAGLVLAIMILPIITAISRDVFAQTPRDHIEAALALGSTKWEVIKTAVLPYGRSGVVAASMLGLGRALGETVAVMIILSATQKPGVSTSLFGGGETFASKIASAASEFDDARKTGAYIAAGLVLFVVTFIVNALARIVADSGKAKS